MTNPKESPGYVDSEYLKTTAELLQHVKQRSYEMMRMKEGQAVLDVGCGPGFDTTQMAKVVGMQGKVVGVDYDEEMVRKAGEKARDSGVDSWTTHQIADATHLPFDDGQFDCSRSERVFQHLLNPRDALAEMIRVTRPGGWIVVADTDHATTSVDTDEIELERRLVKYRVEKMQHNACSGRQLYRYFKQAGLQDINVDMHGIPITDYAIANHSGGIDKVFDSALEAGVVTSEEVDRIRSSLEKAVEEGVYFSSSSIFIVAGKKPDR